MLIILSSVRRDEVQSPASSRSPSPVDESDIRDAHARLGRLLDLDDLINSATTSQETQQPIPPADDNAENEEQEFEFRLFSAPTKSNETTTSAQKESDGDKSKKSAGSTNGSGQTQKLRIRLRSPTPDTDPSQGRFIRAFRGWQYYFTTPSLYGIDGEPEYVAEQAGRRREFEETAVSGEQMTEWAKSQPWVCLHH